MRCRNGCDEGRRAPREGECEGRADGGLGMRVMGVVLTWQILEPSAGFVYSVRMIVVLQLFAPLAFRPRADGFASLTALGSFCVGAFVVSSGKACGAGGGLKGRNCATILSRGIFTGTMPSSLPESEVTVCHCRS